MRMEVTQLPTGVTVLNDAYNANPASMAAALSTLAASRGRRRLAALGEMRELGEEAPRAHRELGAAAAGARLDALFLLGPHAAEVRAGAEAAGLPAERITIAASHDELAARLAAYCRRSEEHTSELQSHHDLVCRLLLEKKKSERLVKHAHRPFLPTLTATILTHRLTTVRL